MATGRVTKVRSVTRAAGTGRVTHIRTVSNSGSAGRVTKVRTVATGILPTTSTVQPYDSVNLGAGTWTQTSGPTVAVPTFTAPAVKGGAVLTFTSSAGGAATVTVKPHTLFRITASGLVPFRYINL